MDIFIERSKQTIKQEFSGTAQELLDKLSINPEEILIIKNGQLVTEDEELSTEDEIRLLSVVSGG
ncbi:MoaD/ThiS family protein [Candidatus Woesearchaeota archaeon]|nr:MoaD/ThiS family protein [Candidatus Woesearchaeota archaeon]